MAINRWREVEYTSDGNYAYQCLKCYGEWESRTRPNGGRITTRWRFCPYCGTEWDGQHSCRPIDEPRYPRPARPDSLAYDQQVVWCIEYRTITEEHSSSGVYVKDVGLWRHNLRYSAERYTAKQILEILKGYREDSKEDMEWDGGWRMYKEYRARRRRREAANVLEILNPDASEEDLRLAKEFYFG